MPEHISTTSTTHGSPESDVFDSDSDSGSGNSSENARRETINRCLSINVRFASQPELLAKIQALAKREQRSVNGQILKMIADATDEG